MTTLKLDMPRIGGAAILQSLQASISAKAGCIKQLGFWTCLSSLRPVRPPLRAPGGKGERHRSHQWYWLRSGLCTLDSDESFLCVATIFGRLGRLCRLWLQKSDCAGGF